MTRLAVGLCCAVIASGVTATANSDALNFWLTNGPSSKPLDIRPGGALPAAPRFVQGRLKCARNVNAHLHHMGYRGTGSDMARSFATYGKPVSGPQVGAIQVERRGRNPNAGHVQIVHSQRSDGVWMCRNPSSRVGDWTLNPCANSRVLAYRMPTGADLLPSRMYTGNTAKPRQTPFPVAVSVLLLRRVGTFGPAIVPASFGAMTAYAVIQ
jgi:hypothetical protein